VNRRALGIAVAVAIAAAAFQPFYLRIFAVNRARMGAMLVEMPYRKTPGLRLFFEGVRARTRTGDSIAIAAPFPTWEHGYDYVYSRSTYVLAGRRVLVLLDPSNRPQPQNLARAQFVAAYRIHTPFPNFVAVWEGPDGTLLRRVK
jgi:hypothetical protein